MSAPHPADTGPAEPAEGAGAPQPRTYVDAGDWVQDWFADTVAVRLSGGDTTRGLTWCAQWWKHDGVATRLHALWQAWEAARAAGDTAAMSTWWVHHADPTLRVLLNGETGPMWRCSPTQHRPIASLPVTPAPAGWFDADPERGPSVRAPSPTPPPGQSP